MCKVILVTTIKQDETNLLKSEAEKLDHCRKGVREGSRIGVRVQGRGGVGVTSIRYSGCGIDVGNAEGAGLVWSKRLKSMWCGRREGVVSVVE